MEAKIAVATVSGRAYYLLVNELKNRKIDFLSLTPFETVPLNVKVVITTEPERKHINHSNILVFKDVMDPLTTIDEALRLVEGKKSSETLIVGVDPGKTFGIAVLNDGQVIKTCTCSSSEETVEMIVDIFKRERGSSVRVLKVGSASASYATDLTPMLDAALPKDVSIEIVQEAGTTRGAGETLHKRRFKHTMAAIRIAQRRGRVYNRTGASEKT